jgi:ribosomal protein S18 acetylase RimI-like enzyme
VPGAAATSKSPAWQPAPPFVANATITPALPRVNRAEVGARFHWGHGPSTVGSDVAANTIDGMGAHIRHATSADVEAVRDLADRLREGVAPWRDDAAVTSAVRGWVDSSIQAMNEPGHAVLVAELDRKVVGFITLSPGSHWSGDVEPSIGELVVATDAEGQGVGRALVEAVMEHARERGFERISVSTGAANTRARRLYEHLGFDDEDVTLSRTLL